MLLRTAATRQVVQGEETKLFRADHGRTFARSETTLEHLDDCWELVDEILKTLLIPTGAASIVQRAIRN